MFPEVLQRDDGEGGLQGSIGHFAPPVTSKVCPGRDMGRRPKEKRGGGSWKEGERQKECIGGGGEEGRNRGFPILLPGFSLSMI